MLLENQVCLVSGVGPGLGREVALACAREGATVVVAARTAAYIEEVAAEITNVGATALAVATDVTDPAARDNLVSATISRFGRIDTLVNSAYRPDVFQSFEEVDLNLWRKIMDVNLFGNLALTQRVIPIMKQAGHGSVVFINSMIVRKVLAGQGGYAVSKGALLTAAQVLAKELGPAGIRVNTVVPGFMWGPPVQRFVAMESARLGITPEAVVEAIVAEIPLGHIPEDADCANAVVFFASELSRVITGQSLDVNGGEYFH
ncbi:MAG: SDR family oxidoreductase [Acidimicrobiales bacterium]